MIDESKLPDMMALVPGLEWGWNDMFADATWAAITRDHDVYGIREAALDQYVVLRGAYEIAVSATLSDAKATAQRDYAERVVRSAPEVFAELLRLREALKRIAAFDDKTANAVLSSRGSYGSFDEPGSVQITRAALNPEPQP